MPPVQNLRRRGFTLNSLKSILSLKYRSMRLSVKINDDSGLFNVGLITRYVYLWAIWIQRFHHVSFHKFWHAINVKAMNWSTSDNVHGRAVLCEVLNQTKHQLCRGSNFNWTTDASRVKIWASHRGGDEVFGQHALELFTVNGKNGCFCDNHENENEKMKND